MDAGPNKKTVFAHDVDYWKTGNRRTAAQWVELAVKQLKDHGAANVVQATGEQDGRPAFMLQFDLDGERHRVVWPALPLNGYMDKPDNQRAAVVQAATTLYHDVKARCVAAARYGNATGFFQFRLLEDGRTVQQLADPDLTQRFPAFLPAPATVPRLTQTPTAEER